VRNIVNSISANLQSNRQVLKNMTWLTVLQFANYLIPLLIIPYIVRVLGAEVFGKVTYAQNIISYFTLLINFGFEYSATREIAVNREDKVRCNQIFWSVIKQKAMLLLVSFVSLLLLFLFFDRVEQNFTLYLFVFLLNIGVVIFPVFYFQGMEDMGRMAIFNMLIRSSGLVFTIFFVKSAADYMLYPLFISLGFIVCGVVSLWYVIHHYDIHYIRTDWQTYRDTFRNGSPVFLNSMFASLYTTANLTILGIYFGDYEVGLYGGTQKIIIAIMMVTSTPVNLAIYPQISRRFKESLAKGKKYFQQTILKIAVFGLFLSVITYFAAPLLVRIILGGEFEAAIPLLQLFAPLPFLVILASLFTIQGLYGSGLQRYAPFVGATLGIFSIVFNLLIVPKYGIFGAGLAWVISECLEIAIAAGIFYWGMKYKKNTVQ